MTPAGPVRVLQVVGSLNRAGTETWLVHALRYLDQGKFAVDFLVHTGAPGDHDAELQAAGARIIRCLGHARPWEYARNFRRAMDEYGPYDIVHSHVHHFSGYVLWLAKRVGVPVRIAHSHLDTVGLDRRAVGWRRMYLQMMQRLISCYATLCLAASSPAARALFGPACELDSRVRVLHCGIDLAPFSTPVNAPQVRSELGLPPDAFVVGHAGRFHAQKNHGFLLDIFAEVAQREPEAWLLLIGDGPLRPLIKQEVCDRGLADHVIFTGVRSDVPRLMRGAMSVFMFPSQYEGLGLVLIEAQAAGLPCVLSDTVPEEAGVVAPLLCRMSLRQPVGAWADAVLHTRQRHAPFSTDHALSTVAQSSFNIEVSAKQLEAVYESAVRAAGDAASAVSSGAGHVSDQ